MERNSVCYLETGFDEKKVYKSVTRDPKRQNSFDCMCGSMISGSAAAHKEHYEGSRHYEEFSKSNQLVSYMRQLSIIVEIFLYEGKRIHPNSDVGEGSLSIIFVTRKRPGLIYYAVIFVSLHTPTTRRNILMDSRS